MVAGATGIDLALVCIACDDGVMPQTREHLAILDAARASRAASSRSRSATWWTTRAPRWRAADAAEALRADAARADARYVEVSRPHRPGPGRAARGAAAAAAATRVAPPRGGRARLPVDRVFSLRGIGTVVTGTLWSGTLAVGDRVTLLPQRHATAASARCRRTTATSSEAVDGGRVAACLVGVERTDIAARRRARRRPARRPTLATASTSQLQPRAGRADGARRRPRRGAARHGGRRTPAWCCSTHAARPGATASRSCGSRSRSPRCAATGSSLRTLAPPDDGRRRRRCSIRARRATRGDPDGARALRALADDAGGRRRCSRRCATRPVRGARRRRQAACSTRRGRRRRRRRWSPPGAWSRSATAG